MIYETKQIVRPGVKLQDHYKYIHLEIVRFSFTIELYKELVGFLQIALSLFS